MTGLLKGEKPARHGVNAGVSGGLSELKEGDIQRQIMIALSAHGHAVFRANNGLFFTKDGRHIASGLPKGFSDLFGFRKDDARAYFMEVKRPGGRVSPEQVAFLAAMHSRGAIAGVVRSVADAEELIRLG